MKVIKTIENKYYFLEDDLKLVEEALTFRKNKGWLAYEMKMSRKTLWSKLNHINGAYFDQVEVERLQEVLNVKFAIN